MFLVAVPEGRVQPAGGTADGAGGSCDPVSPAGQDGGLGTAGAADPASQGGTPFNSLETPLILKRLAGSAFFSS